LVRQTDHGRIDCELSCRLPANTRIAANNNATIVSCNEIGSDFARMVRPVPLANYSTYLVHPRGLHVAQLASKGHVAALYFHSPSRS
jgi:hypothetical protein